MAFHSIRFNSVTQFVEQVGRRQEWVYAQLDKLVCTYVGPGAGAMKFLPGLGSPHHDYPLMFVTDAEIVSQVAGIAEVQVTYTGKFDSHGKQIYIGDPVISFSGVQGSRDFTQGWPYVTSWNEGTETNVNPTPNYNVTTQTTTVRYIGQQVSIRYMVYPLLDRYVYAGYGLGYVWWNVLSQTRGMASTALSNADPITVAQFMSGLQTSVPPLFAAALGIQYEQQGKFYIATETYGPTF